MQQNLKCLDTYRALVEYDASMANNYVLTTKCDLERGGARKWNNRSEKLVAL